MIVYWCFLLIVSTKLRSDPIVQRQTHPLGRELPLVLPHTVGGTHPGVIRLPLPSQQLFLHLREGPGILGVVNEVICLLGVACEFVKFPFVSVIVLPEALEPAGRSTLHCPVQQVLEAWGEIGVLVDGKGHLVVEIVDEFEVDGPECSHGVVHRDLMETLAGKDLVPAILGLRLFLQDREQALSLKSDRVWAEERVSGQGQSVPVQDRWHDVNQ